MAEILLCCGKVCSGKSTFARFMEKSAGYFPFSADDWMLHFYGEPADRQLFDFQLGKCTEMISRIAEQLLASGRNVILDFGFWTKTDRSVFKKRFESIGFTTRIIYFPVDIETQLEFMDKRQSNKNLVHFSFTLETLKILNAKFEEPLPGEADEVKNYCLEKFGKKLEDFAINS